jgi:glycosyltransferase involved in cell wall biosynthesis
MHCSIVIASRNHAALLNNTLASIRSQSPPFGYELIVVDDGSTDETSEVCGRYDIKYVRLESECYRNPCFARNVACRIARGRVLICQSDDVIHRTPDAIERLVMDLHEGEFLIATVYNWDPVTDRFLTPRQYTGLENQRPFFFLGSVWRKDLYAVGGNDEEFVRPAFDDDWLADCLIHGRGLKPRYLPNVVGYHQNHPRPANLARLVVSSERLYRQKVKLAQAGKIPYCASSGPWPYDEN